MKERILLLLALVCWPSFCLAGDALDREVYRREFSYSKGKVTVVASCTRDNQRCSIYSSFSADTVADLEHKIGLMQQRDGIEDAIKHLVAMHIDPHESLRGLSVGRISDSNPEAEALLALAAVRSPEWQHIMATYQTPNPEFGKTYPLFGKLLLSGAFDPLNQLLAKYGLEVVFVGVEKVEEEKFYKLHLHAPGVNSNDKIRVPIGGLVSLAIQPITEKHE